MEHEINAIEWALKEARYQLKLAGEGYRDKRLAETWGADRQQVRREIYERNCDELREIISGLEAALFTVSFDVEGAA